MSVGRPVPASPVWLVLGLLWNMFCHFLHSVYIGRWVVAIGSVLWRSKDDQLQGKGGVTCEDIAKVYHRLHQIKLGGNGHCKICNDLLVLVLYRDWLVQSSIGSILRTECFKHAPD